MSARSYLAKMSRHGHEAQPVLDYMLASRYAWSYLVSWRLVRPFPLLIIVCAVLCPQTMRRRRQWEKMEMTPLHM